MATLGLLMILLAANGVGGAICWFLGVALVGAHAGLAIGRICGTRID